MCQIRPKSFLITGVWRVGLNGYATPPGTRPDAPTGRFGGPAHLHPPVWPAPGWPSHQGGPRYFAMREAVFLSQQSRHAFPPGPGGTLAHLPPVWRSCVCRAARFCRRTPGRASGSAWHNPEGVCFLVCIWADPVGGAQSCSDVCGRLLPETTRERPHPACTYYHYCRIILLQSYTNHA